MRSLAEGKGMVFVCAKPPGRQGLRHRQQGRQRWSEALASGLYLLNGVAFRDGTPHRRAFRTVPEIEHVEDNLDNHEANRQSDDNLPKDEAHGWEIHRDRQLESRTFWSDSPATTSCMTTRMAG